jgi:hypothetical protein
LRDWQAVVVGGRVVNGVSLAERGRGNGSPP